MKNHQIPIVDLSLRPNPEEKEERIKVVQESFTFVKDIKWHNVDDISRMQKE